MRWATGSISSSARPRGRSPGAAPLDGPSRGSAPRPGRAAARETWGLLIQLSEGFPGNGRCFVASFKMSRSSTSSPIFGFSFLMCSSFSASSSLGPAAHSRRRAGRAPASSRSRPPSTHASAPPAPQTFPLSECSPPGPPAASPSSAGPIREGRWPLPSAPCRDRITAYRWTQLRVGIAGAC